MKLSLGALKGIVRKALNEAREPEPDPEYFEDDLNALDDCLVNFKKYVKVMTKAVTVLQPAAECLKSKPISRILRNAVASVEGCAPRVQELVSLRAFLAQLDQEAIAEERRLIGIWQQDGGREISVDEVTAPQGYATYLERVEAFNNAVSDAFENLELSLEEIGTAGSPALKAYEKLMELRPSWEDDLLIPEPLHDMTSFAETIAESILDSASMNVPAAQEVAV